MNPENLREDFPVLKQTVENKPVLYFDNAATALTPTPVIDAVNTFYREYNANVHRGIHTLSEEATNRFEQTRKHAAQFFNAATPENIVFTSGTTESINTVAHSLQPALSAEDNIVISALEHHSNLVPWQQLCNNTGAELRYINVTEQGTIDTEHAKTVIDTDTAVVAVSQLSNVFGAVNNIKSLADTAHDNNAQILVDAAQSAPHLPIDVQNLDVDFLACSGHKMLGPTGIGILYGTENALKDVEPLRYGGSMIDTVQKHETTFATAPTRFEGGTPNIAGVFGLDAALTYLENTGMDNVREHSELLGGMLAQGLRERFNDQITVYGNEEHVGIVSFTFEEVHPHDLASLLDMQGVAIRAGHHCTQPLHEDRGVAATARASTYLYNTADEVARFVDTVEDAVQVFQQ